MGFKIVSRKTAKTLARGTSVSNTSWSSESPRVKPGHMWASSCCFPFLSAENYIPHLDIHHRCASSFVGGCFHIVFLLSVTLLYFVVSPDNLFFFHLREYFLVFFHVYWYSKSAADTSLAFGTTRSGWWMNGKALTILNKSCLSKLSQIMASKTLKKYVLLTDSEVQTFLQG